MEHVSSFIIQKLEIMAGAPDADLILSKRKAASALFPYAVRLAQEGQQGMIDAILHVASKSTSGGFMWRRIGPYITSLFDESSPSSLNLAITLTSPCADWGYGDYTEKAVARWAAAALDTPYSEAVGQSVVDVLLQIAYNDALRSHIPGDIWELLKKEPSPPPLPPVCKGRFRGTYSNVIHHVQELGDVEILKSYLLLVLSEWDPIHSTEADIAIGKDFGGIEMSSHREALIKRLDHVLRELDKGLEHFQRHQPQDRASDIEFRKQQYGNLREELLGMDGEAVGSSPCKPPSRYFSTVTLIIVSTYRIFTRLSFFPSSLSVISYL